MNHKTRSYRRWQRARHIQRRKRICNSHTAAYTEEVTDEAGKKHLVSDHSREVPIEWYNTDGKYAKGKIHCGCRICKPGKMSGAPSWVERKGWMRFEAHLREYEQDAA